ncbi:hypothetical protein JR316_0006712 [Psilocybe cubensis]|uniref:Uncharacterized protein n=2 Tax=Psilocybe cubensis TaxID=181762 RepID=A0ACB8GWJ5_PSICU|nr:hypothetical protein JR316_0006712 [Psilocybe cubensis]KAH9480115.1 hypothetical protein JR316_0006712 [Psilocybe cubensis]
MTTHTSHKRGVPHSALDVLAPPRSHRYDSHSRSPATLPPHLCCPAPPVNILNSLNPVHNVTLNGDYPPLRARRSESSVSYSKKSSSSTSCTTLNKDYSTPKPSKSTLSRAKSVASQFLRSKRLETSNNLPPSSRSSLNMSKSLPSLPDKNELPLQDTPPSPTLLSSPRSICSSSSSAPLLSGSDSVHLRSTENYRNRSDMVAVEIAEDKMNATLPEGTNERNYKFTKDTTEPRTTQSKSVVCGTSATRTTIKREQSRVYAAEDMHSATAIPSGGTLSLSPIPPSIPSNSLNSGSGAHSFKSISEGKSRRMTINVFPSSNQYIKTGKHDGHGFDVIKNNFKEGPPPGGNQNHRWAHHTNVLNGEWNQPDMQHVIDKLRALR